MRWTSERVRDVGVGAAGGALLAWLVAFAAASAQAPCDAPLPPPPPRAYQTLRAGADTGSLTAAGGARAGGAARAPIKLYVDLGLNNGDSVTQFVTAPGGIFGGGPQLEFVGDGGGKPRLAGRGAAGDWEVWGFEANPKWTSKLNALQRELMGAHPPRAAAMKFYTATAAWTDDVESLPFFHDNFKGNDFEGGATMVRTFGAADLTRTEQVAGVDVARLLAERGITEADTVVLKVDIEGSEFSLLRHLLRTGLLGLVDEVLTEWHDWGPDQHDETHTQHKCLSWMMDGLVRAHDWG
jgi:FkbM family methyltransferase